MEEKKLPKVLAVSLSTWRADSGIHTQTDLFGYWDPERIAQIYTRSDLPDTPVCDRFFQISENAVMKSILTCRPVGRRVENGAQADAVTVRAQNEEKKLYAKAHRRKSWFMTLMREVVWGLGRWKTAALDHFVEEEAPDLYFIPVYPVIFMARIQLYLLKKHPKPYVCYLFDDNYSYRACGKNPLSYVHRFFLRRVVKEISENCNEMFAITRTQAEDTDSLFGTHSVVLTKGIDYSHLTYSKKPVINPIRMVYTGKLVIGRAASLVAIARALENINCDGLRMCLDIYTPDTLDKKTTAILNTNGCRLCGSVPHDQIAGIQEAADIAVFVESLENEYRYAARLSFSTKLTDYFRSGKCILAIGDETIAPIVYLRDNDAAVIVSDYAVLEDKLHELCDRPELVAAYGKKAFDCGRRNHDENKVRQTFCSVLARAAGGDAKMAGR